MNNNCILLVEYVLFELRYVRPSTTAAATATTTTTTTTTTSKPTTPWRGCKRKLEETAPLDRDDLEAEPSAMGAPASCTFTVQASTLGEYYGPMEAALNPTILPAMM